MKSQLLSLLMFAAPLMLQTLMSDRPASSESSSVSAEPAKEVAPTTQPAPATKPAPSPAPACTSCAPAKPAPAPAASTPACTRPGGRVPAKLAPWFM